MIFLLGSLLLIATGYSILLYGRFDRGNIFFDAALSWFLGCGYFCLAWFLLNFGMDIKTGAITSLTIILLPLALLFLNKDRLYITLGSYREPGKTFPALPSGHERLIFILLIGFSLIVFLGAALHAVNSPLVSDDALRLRAFTPSLVYRNVPLVPQTVQRIFYNGIWPSYIPTIYWHINGAYEPFYINYYNSISLLSFFMLLLFAPWSKQNPMQGAYSLFLATTLPLFIVQSTSPMSDVPLAVSISLGFLFFIFYSRGGDEKDLRTALIFFTITCFIKDKGEFAGLGGMAACLAAVLFHKIWNKNWPPLSTLLILGPAVSYFLVKNLHTSALYWVSTQTAGNIVNLFEASAEPVRELANYTFDSKQDIFLYSTFISGNQGLIFFFLVATVLYNIKGLLFTRRVFESVFMSVLIAAVYFKVAVINMPLDALSDWIHRYLMVPALLSAVWIPSLWFNGKTNTNPEKP